VDGSSVLDDDFSLSGTTLTLASAPPAPGSAGRKNINVVYSVPLSIGTPADQTVGTTKLIDQAVTTAKLIDQAVTTAKLANDAVTADKIATSAVGTSEIAANISITGLTLLDGYTEEVFTITDGASVDLNPSNGSIQIWTLGANRSPTASSFASGRSMTLLVNDGSARTITWPSVIWAGGAAPTLATSGYTVIELWKVGTALYGVLVGKVA
jgi:hypothetical protein